jgi:ABC-type dipeptide/oligopeptide/nickel transport system permease component
MKNIPECKMHIWETAKNKDDNIHTKEGTTMGETKFVSEAEYLKFKNGLRNIIIKIIIGFVLGMVLGLATGMGASSIFIGILLAGMPYAWSVIPVFAFGWISILIKLCIAAVLGWIITPIAFIYNLVQMKRYEKAVAEHVIVEANEKV